MNNSNVFTTVLISILVIILGFFFLNNVTHIGFHTGHNHDHDHDEHEYGGMMDMMFGHDEYHTDYVDSYEMSPRDVVEKIRRNKDIVLLDVRTPEEYAEVHLENALLLPVGELSANTLAGINLGDNAKDKEIIIYCRSGARSKQAYDIMNSLGYTNITSVAGGMVHWQEDKYPFTETGEYDGTDSNITSVNDSDARISFDRAVHDFGDVPQSQGILQTTFTVRNTGKSLLNIGELSTSCGCTTAEISNENIAPGDAAILTVYFDPDFHKEPSDKLTRTIFIPTNDPNNLEAEVKITVDILEGE
ncbi:DUF1573 domain-containing protein [Candidatus Kaiserbacteria bacterium]|nr:MAG: DUF1573 domain-containing protein [Candidatus Kaiserbacteria bacterium]